MKKNKILILLIIAVLICVGIASYYFFGNGSRYINNIVGYRFSYEPDSEQEKETDSLSELLNDYLGQYEKFYIPRKQKIKDYTIDNIEDIGKESVSRDFLEMESAGVNDTADIFYNSSNEIEVNVAQIDFTITTVKDGNYDLAYSLDGTINNDSLEKINCQWVVYYQIINEESGKRNIIVWKEMRPAAYDIMKYKSSGQAEIDERNAEEQRKENSLKRNDEGKAIGQLDGSIFWVNNNVGYDVRLVDKAMSQEWREIYTTTDGGNTWNDIGEAPSTYAMLSYGFINEKLGFFCYKWVEGETTNFYLTNDGGKTFKGVALPKIKVKLTEKETYEPFDTPEVPWEENGVLYMHLGQGEDGDYDGGSKALLISKDKGETWEYTGKNERTTNRID